MAPGPTDEGADPGLTDKDMDRINEYLQTPVYERDPEQLLPMSAAATDEEP